MTSTLLTRHVDAIAKGPNPRDRIEPPKRGKRCPRCHVRAPNANRCELCNPEVEV